MSYVSILFLLGAAFFFYRFARGRGFTLRSKAAYTQDVLVAVGDSDTISLHYASFNAEGNIVVDGVVYPISVARRCLSTSTRLPVVYFIGIDASALVNHRALERARRSVLTGSLFKPAGDLTEMLRLASAVLVIIAAVTVYFQVGSLSSSLARNEAVLLKMDGILSKPLVVDGSK